MKKNYIKTAIFALAALGMTACSSDGNEPQNPVESDFEGIVISLPNLSGTRANDPVISENEAYINNLVVLAYPQGSGTFAVENITTGIQGTTTTYEGVKVRLAPGKYHVYVLANVAQPKNLDVTALASVTSWSSVTSSNLSEDDLTGARLTLSPMQKSVVTGSGGTSFIPMSADKTAIYKDENNTLWDNNQVVISARTATDVYADLTPAVAKVRVTVLNNTTPELTMAASTPATLTGHLTKEGIFADQENDVNVASAAATLGGGIYYQYPSGATGANWAASDLTTLKLDTEKAYAWPGSWYIPGGLFDAPSESDVNKADDTNCTRINLAFSDSSYDKHYPVNYGLSSSSGVERAHYYDHVYYVSTKAVTLQVKVNKWTYHKAVIDLQDL